MSRCSSCHRYYRYCRCQNHFAFERNNYGNDRKNGIYLGNDSKKLNNENKYLENFTFNDKHNYGPNKEKSNGIYLGNLKVKKHNENCLDGPILPV